MTDREEELYDAFITVRLVAVAALFVLCVEQFSSLAKTGSAMDFIFSVLWVVALGTTISTRFFVEPR